MKKEVSKISKEKKEKQVEEAKKKNGENSEEESTKEPADYFYCDNTVFAQYIKSPFPNQKLFYFHSHNHYELYRFISGRGTYKVEGTSYELKNGDIMLLRPGESHYIEIDESVPYERLVVHFSDYTFKMLDPAGKLLTPFNDRPLGTNNLYNSKDFENNNYHIYAKSIITPASDKKMQIISNLLPLLNEIAKAYKNKKKVSLKSTLIERILAMINEQIFEDINLDTISQNFFISKAQLCKIFKNHTGTTVYNYILQKRLLAAQKLILDGNSPTDIYTSCGFNDYSTFYRAYKKRFGYSPKKTNKQSVLTFDIM